MSMPKPTRTSDRCVTLSFKKKILFLCFVPIIAFQAALAWENSGSALAVGWKRNTFALFNCSGVRVPHYDEMGGDASVMTCMFGLT